MILIIAACPLRALAAQQQAGNFGISEAGTPAKKYFPGDIIHLVVQAPIDTDTLSALMPDNRTIKFTYEPPTNLWHGYWEVPQGFKKGSYTANLVAMDFDGNTFEGLTSTFFIGEPVVQTAGLSPSEEASLKEQQAKKLAAEALLLAEESQQKLGQAQAMLKGQENAAAVTRTAPVVAAVQPAVKPVNAAIPKSKQVAAKPKRVAARPKRVATMITENEIRLALITKARTYIINHDYGKAKEQLLALLKLQPDDTNIKLMLNRIEAIIKSERETP